MSPSKNHFTLFVKSDDQPERFPDNNRGEFEIDLCSRMYKLDPSKRYYITVNNIAVNHDIEDVEIVYQPPNPLVKLALVWTEPNYSEYDSVTDRTLPIAEAEVLRRIELPENLLLKGLPMEVLVLSMAVPLLKNQFKTIQRKFQIDMYNWEEVPYIDLVDDDYKGHKERYNVHIRTTTVGDVKLTLILYAARKEGNKTFVEYRSEMIAPYLSANSVTINGEKGVSVSKQAFYSFVNAIFEKCFFGLSYPMHIKRSKDYLERYVSMTLGVQFEKFDLRVPDEIGKIINIPGNKLTTNRSAPVLTLPDWSGQTHNVHRKTTCHFCVEVNDCENNTLSRTSRSIIKICSIENPSSSKTRYDYINKLSHVPEYTEISSNNIRRLKFKLTNIDGELLKFRHSEVQQKGFPTIISVTVEEHGE